MAAMGGSKTRPLRGAGFVSGLNRVLPLQRYYAPVLALLNRDGDLEVPYAGAKVLVPSEWPKSVAATLLKQEDMVPEFGLVRDLVGGLKSGTIVDVGANMGHFLLMMRREAARPVICYEPEPRLFGLLRKTVEINGIADVDCRHLACGDEEGEISIDVGSNGAIHFEGDPRESVPVRVVTLDQDLADVEEISFLKIDCEGFEAHVLEGARAILEKHRPLLYVELHPHFLRNYGKDPEQVLKILEECGKVSAWIFYETPYWSRIRRSLQKFRRPRAVQLSGLDEVRALCASGEGPAQIYLLADPR